MARKHPRRPTPKSSASPSRGRKISRWIWGGIVVLATLSGLVVWLPRLTVDPGGQIDPAMSSPIQFTITNTGIVPLWNVRPAIGICQLAFGQPFDPKHQCHTSGLARLVPTLWFSRRLGMDERHTIRLDDVFKVSRGLEFTGADVSIAIYYHFWFIPIQQHKEFRFFTRQERDGKFSWVHRSLSK